MNCPYCGNELRPSKKEADYVVCDTCRKKFRASTFEEKYGDDKYEEPRSRKPKKKKSKAPVIIAIIAVFVVLGIAISLLGGEDNDAGVADSGSTNTSGEQGEAITESNNQDDGIIDFEGEGFHVTYVKHEIGEDYDGNPCLIYYYTFTNLGDDNISPAAAAYIQCFQNGVQCDPAITTDGSSDNYLTEVQPGASVEVSQAYALEDSSEVTIEASTLVSFSDDKDVQIITLE